MPEPQAGARVPEPVGTAAGTPAHGGVGAPTPACLPSFLAPPPQWPPPLLVGKSLRRALTRPPAPAAPRRTALGADAETRTWTWRTQTGSRGLDGHIDVDTQRGRAAPPPHGPALAVGGQRRPGPSFPQCGPLQVLLRLAAPSAAATPARGTCQPLGSRSASAKAHHLCI